MFWSLFRVFTCSSTFWRNMVILEPFEVQNCTDASDVQLRMKIFLRSYFDKRYNYELAFQFHRFEVNQHPIAEVMPVLLKSGQSASREEAVAEMKDCRSTVHSFRQSTVMPEYGLSIFYDRLKPRSNYKLPEYPWTT